MQAKLARGKIAKPAQRASWCGYVGYFIDPDSYLWKVAVGYEESPFPAEVPAAYAA